MHEEKKRSCRLLFICLNEERIMCFPVRMSAAMVLMVAALSHAAEADPAAGKRKTVTCNACHGQSGFKSMPRLGGQSAAYLIAALRAYKEDRRAHATMRDVAHALSERDIADLAAHYAAVQKIVGESTATAPTNAERCAACHGAEGAQPVTPEVALIAGQSAGYLEQTLREYKTGARPHAVMQEQVRELGDAQIAELAAWYAAQKGLSVK
jgi:cytochrome c553